MNGNIIQIFMKLRKKCKWLKYKLVYNCKNCKLINELVAKYFYRGQAKLMKKKVMNLPIKYFHISEINYAAPK